MIPHVGSSRRASRYRGPNRIDSFGALGRSQLAQSPLVEAELASAGLSDTPFQRGRTLSRLIRREVQQQFEEREERPTARNVAEWSILYLRVHSGLSLQDIATRLNMPMRSVAVTTATPKNGCWTGCTRSRSRR
jgi:hypothetical protein